MEIRTQVPLAPLTTLKIGGNAAYIAEVRSDAEVRDACAYAHTHDLPWMVIGAGSNLLVSDDGYPGLIIRILEDHVEVTDEHDQAVVVAAAGKSWDDLVSEMVHAGWWGMENLSGIPSSVGASVVQNIGAYGVEVGTLVEWVEVFDPMEGVRRITRDACRFGYRDSIFKHDQGKQLVVLRVAYRLFRSGNPKVAYKDLEVYHGTVAPIVTLSDVRTAVLSVRSGKFPHPSEAGTAGSFFMNPVVETAVAEQFRSRFPDAPYFPQQNGMVKLSAAWIIDHALSMRGVRMGNVGTWPTQALIVVNYGGATAQELITFVDLIRTRARAEVGIDLVPEVIMLGATLS